MNMELMALSTAQIQFSINMGTTSLIILIIVHFQLLKESNGR